MRKIEPEKVSRGGESLLSDIDRFPSFNIDTKHLPEAKEWDVGETYIIKLKVKMTGISIHEGRNGKESGYADFDIKGIEPQKKKKEFKLLYND